MLLLRQIGSTLTGGAQTELYGTADYNEQVTDVNSRYILRLAGPGKVSNDRTVIAPGGTNVTIPLPQNYDETKRLYVAVASDQVVQVFFNSPVFGAGSFLVNPGASSDQQGIAAFLGLTASLSVSNNGEIDATVEWFLFELPDITTPAGWRDGALATGVLGPGATTNLAPPIPSPPANPVVSFVDSVYLDYTQTSVNSVSWTQIVVSTPSLINLVSVFDGSGQPMLLGMGAAGAEAEILLIPPGGISNQSYLTIPAGSRLSLKAAVSGQSATIGQFILNGFS